MPDDLWNDPRKPVPLWRDYSTWFAFAAFAICVLAGLWLSGFWGL